MRPARWRAAAVTFAAALVLVTACGVPSGSDPVDVGKAPGVREPGVRSDAKLPDPNDAADAGDLVDRFLQAAAAADWNRASRERRVEAAAAYLKGFLTPDAARGWQPNGQIQIVVVEPTRTVSVNKVTVTMTPVGVLNDYGGLDPVPPGTPAAAPTITYVFDVVRAAGERGEWRIAKPPPTAMLLLSTKGLRELYQLRPVYFWGSDNSHLIPDVRYMPNGISAVNQAREVVDRLIQGPSDWLKSVVRPLPDDTKTDNPVLHGDKIEVRFNVAIDSQPESLKRLAWQLRWSLRPLTLDRAVEIKIEDRTQLVEGTKDYRARNAAVVPSDDQRLYAVLEGKVVPVERRGAPAAVLGAPENTAVLSAAVRHKGTAAALVRQGAKGMELVLSRYQEGETTGPRYRRADLPSCNIGRPAFLGDTNRLVVTCGGRLFLVNDDGGTSELTVPGSVGPVTAVSAAPDGRRLALVAGEKVFVAALNPSAAPALGRILPIHAAPLLRARGVAWRFEHQLVIAGFVAGGLSGLVEATIDNGYRSPINITNLGNLEITSIASVPRDPTEDQAGPIVIEAGGQAYNVFGTLVPVTIIDPSPQPTTPPPSTPLRAPFFLA